MHGDDTTALQHTVPLDRYGFTYVFPCGWEDDGKIGFSRDPLSRISALHPRWFEFFDLGAGTLVEADTVREARGLELQLRLPPHIARWYGFG